MDCHVGGVGQFETGVTLLATIAAGPYLKIASVCWLEIHCEGGEPHPTPLVQALYRHWFRDVTLVLHLSAAQSGVAGEDLDESHNVLYETVCRLEWYNANEADARHTLPTPQDPPVGRSPTAVVRGSSNIVLATQRIHNLQLLPFMYSR